jgi:O-antigen/teichoic acid export membrane protein
MARFDLLRRTLYITSGQSVSKIVEFVSAVVLVRLLAPSDWTTIALALTIYETAIGIGGLNIQDGIYFFYTRVEARKRLSLALQTALMLLASALLVAVIVLATGRWLGSKGPEIAPLIPWLALAVVLELPSSIAPQVLVAAERPKWASIFDTWMSLQRLALMAVPLAAGWGILAAAHGMALHSALRGIVCLVLLPRVLPKGRPHIDLTLVKAQLVYTAPLALSIASTVLNKYVDKWFVAAFVPRHLFGAYAVAAREVPFVPMIGMAMGNVLATRITHAFQSRQPERALAYWLAATSRVSLIVVPLTIGLLLCAPEALTMIFGTTYEVAVVPFQLFNLILLHRVMAWGLMLRAAGATRALWLTSVVMLGLNIAFALPLTYFYGMRGAALGTFLAYIPNVVFFLYCIARVTNTSLRRAFPWLHYARILGISFICATAAWWLGGYAGALWPGHGDLARLIAKGAVFTASYLSLARLVAVGRNLPHIPQEDAEFLGAVVTRNRAAVQPAA